MLTEWADNTLAAPELPALSSREVHVWSIRLDVGAPVARSLESLLCPEERLRADRFRIARDRRRYVVRRGTLRRLLGAYSRSPAHELGFEYGPRNKPALASPDAAPPLRFNVTSTGDLALIAICRGRDVGIDVERITALAELEQMAEAFCSSRELKTILALSDRERTQAFFNCWTRKEAYVKARGVGLSAPLHRIEVAVLPVEPPALVRSDEPARRAGRWSMFALQTGPAHAGALVVEGHDLTVRPLGWRQGPREETICTQ